MQFYSNPYLQSSTLQKESVCLRETFTQRELKEGPGVILETSQSTPKEVGEETRGTQDVRFITFFIEDKGFSGGERVTTSLGPQLLVSPHTKH